MNRLARILQVEDSPEDRMMTAEALGEVLPAADLRSVATTKEAIAVISAKGEWRPSVVLLDLSLPGETGFAMLQFVKSQPHLQSIPVIVFSSSKAQADIDQAYRLGANCYIPKPPDFEGYLALMALLIQFSVSCVELPFPCQGYSAADNVFKARR
jgi:two-component system, chemotaxis family, response regulator Rcp1